jgi:hypothetical protein
MHDKWLESKPDGKKGYLAKLFRPCGTGKHDQCAVELAMYRCSYSCHYPNSDASEGERQPSQNVASGNATRHYFAYDRSRTHLALFVCGCERTGWSSW